MNKKMIRPVAIILVGVMLAIASAYGAITSLTVPTTGHISMINLYSDSACTQQVTSIGWGNLLPDSSLQKVLYLKNWGATSVGINLTVGNWLPPEAPSYIQITWDRENEVLTAGMALMATFTITVFPNVTTSSIGDFSNDLTVHAAW